MPECVVHARAGVARRLRRDSTSGSSASAADQRGGIVGRGDDVEVLDRVGHGGAASRRPRRARRPGARAARRRSARRSSMRAREHDARRRAAPSSCSASVCSSFSSTLAPNPRSPRICCRSAAARSASSESMPSSSYSRRARLGPKPGRCMTEISPAGNLRAQLDAPPGCRRSRRARAIFSSSVLPMFGSSVTRPSRASAATDTEDVAHGLAPRCGRRSRGTGRRRRARRGPPSSSKAAAICALVRSATGHVGYSRSARRSCRIGHPSGLR